MKALKKNEDQEFQKPTKRDYSQKEEHLKLKRFKNGDYSVFIEDEDDYDGDDWFEHGPH